MGPLKRVFIIAEAGVNHNGDLDRALAMVDCAAAAGADAVKFQTFKAESLVTHSSPKAAYQVKTTRSGSQLAMLKALELRESDHFVLAERCREKKIEFLSTPFDLASLRFLVDHDLVQRIKIPSGELTHGPLLYEAARTGKPMIISTGMATPEEVAMALQVVRLGFEGGVPSEFSWDHDSSMTFADLVARVTLLHCTTAYPTPFHEANLRAMVTLRERFGVAVGYSDHTEGVAIAMAATALGATVVEKHFTLDRNLEGPDHQASIEPEELVALVAGIRNVEKALGDGTKRPLGSELENAKVARKSLMAATAISAGTLFSADNLAIKRPGGGRSPMEYWRVLGTPAMRDYLPDEPID